MGMRKEMVRRDEKGKGKEVVNRTSKGVLKLEFGRGKG